MSSRGNISFSIASRLPMKSTQPPTEWAVSLGVRQQKQTADNSPPSSAKVSNRGAIPSHPQYILSTTKGSAFMRDITKCKVTEVINAKSVKKDPIFTGSWKGTQC
jgi:hypothetical protein